MRKHFFPPYCFRFLSLFLSLYVCIMYVCTYTHSARMFLHVPRKVYPTYNTRGIKQQVFFYRGRTGSEKAATASIRPTWPEVSTVYERGKSTMDRHLLACTSSLFSGIEWRCGVGASLPLPPPRLCPPASDCCFLYRHRSPLVPLDLALPPPLSPPLSPPPPPSPSPAPPPSSSSSTRSATEVSQQQSCKAQEKSVSRYIPGYLIFLILPLNTLNLTLQT